MSDTTRRAEPTKMAPTVADAERAVERYRKTRSENAELREEVATLTEDYKTLDAENRALNSALVAQREDLRTIPTDGEEWRDGVLYTADMTVTRKGVKYTALRWNQDKPPDKYPEYWAVVVAPSYPHWDTLSGLIEKGTRCMYPDGDGKETVWECQLAHNKFSTFKPKDGSEQWERVK